VAIVIEILIMSLQAVWMIFIAELLMAAAAAAPTILQRKAANVIPSESYSCNTT
jgi:hypothetical protein